MNGNNIGDQKGSKLAILQALRAHGPVSRIDLTAITGLSRATVSLGVGELIDTGIIREATKNGTSRGRPAVLLELTPSSSIVLGAEFSSLTWTIGAFDLMGNTVSRRSIPVGVSDPQVVVDVLVKGLPAMVADLPMTPMPLIGLGMPGLVNTEQGLIVSASDLGWHNVEIGHAISVSLGWPAVVLNRHRSRGLAECRFGAARNFHQVIYVGVSTGIAAGIFHDRKLVTGAVGGAGEIGHVTVDPNGPLCACGNHGCLQAMAAAGALETDARRLIRQGQSSMIDRGPAFDLRLIRADKICSAADRGDELCRTVVGKAAEHLGIVMANLVNTLNPEIIVLGGTIPLSSNYYVESAARMMRRRAMAPLASGIDVRQGAFGELGGALGAATYALDQNLAYSLFKTS